MKEKPLGTQVNMWKKCAFAYSPATFAKFSPALQRLCTALGKRPTSYMEVKPLTSSLKNYSASQQFIHKSLPGKESIGRSIVGIRALHISHFKI